MKIWVDCDGVLADFGSLYLRLLKHLTGREHTLDEITDFDFAKCVATKDEDEKVWRHIDRTPGLIRDLRPIDGAISGLAMLRQFGDVRCLTSPHIGPTWMPERAQWLLSRGFKKAEIVFCSAKELVPGDILIEDRIDACKAWQESNQGGYAILFDQPYNQGDYPLLRAAGWHHVVQSVRDISELKARCA